MKIAFVLDDGLDKPDGVQQYILGLGAHFSTAGHEVHYLVGETHRNDIPNLHVLSRNIKVSFNGNRLTVPLWSSRGRIKSLLAAEKFDVIHVQAPYSPMMAHKVILLAPRSTKIVGTFHILPLAKYQAWASWLLSKVVWRSLRRFSAFCSVSGAAQEFANKTFGIDTVVVPNHVSLAKFNHKPRRNLDVITIGFLGRLVRRKGVMELIDAYASFKKLNPELKTRLIIGGDGAQRRELEEYVATKKLNDVEILGFVPELEKPALLGSMDMAIFPSLGGESFGIVLLEAMASGAGVVLGGNNPGYISVLSPWPDALFSPVNRDEFVSVIHKFVTDAKLRKTIGSEQHSAVRGYDTQVVADKLLNLYS